MISLNIKGNAPREAIFSAARHCPLDRSLSLSLSSYEIHSLYYLSHVVTFYFSVRPSELRSGTARNYALQSARKFIAITRPIL